MKKGQNIEKNKDIGLACKEYRLNILGKTLTEVANKTGTGPNNIYYFESGENDNLNILLYYMRRGFWPWYVEQCRAGRFEGASGEHYYGGAVTETEALEEYYGED